MKLFIFTVALLISSFLFSQDNYCNLYKNVLDSIIKRVESTDSIWTSNMPVNKNSMAVKSVKGKVRALINIEKELISVNKWHLNRWVALKLVDSTVFSEKLIIDTSFKEMPDCVIRKSVKIVPKDSSLALNLRVDYPDIETPNFYYDTRVVFFSNIIFYCEHALIYAIVKEERADHGKMYSYVFKKNRLGKWVVSKSDIKNR